MDTSILIGNPKPRSRTLRVAEAVAQRISPPGFRQSTIDLSDHTDDLFRWPSERMNDLSLQVAGSKILIVATPTYKATYTGLLKSFLDRYSKDALRGVTAVPLMTGADLTHSMAPDVYLRPLLIELGAAVPTRSMYFVMGDMDRMPDIVETWASENLRRLSLN